MYWRRGFQVFFAPGRWRRLGRPRLLLGALWSKLIAQDFILRRGRARWAAHMLIAWGCVLAAAVTFPLVFGWLHFEQGAISPAQTYRVIFFGFRVGEVPLDGAVAWFLFHALVISAFMVIAGVMLAVRRRMRDGVVATAMRPLGGSLADRVGGRRILKVVFPMTAAMAVLLCAPHMVTVTLGALGMAAAIGLGNGAVFKLVPEYFPGAVGSVTGLVGAAGGLGGFFRPLVLGVVKQLTGGYALGFALLALFAVACLVVLVAGERRGTAAPSDAVVARNG